MAGRDAPVPTSVSGAIKAQLESGESHEDLPQNAAPVLMSRRTIIDPLAEARKQAKRDTTPLGFVKVMTDKIELMFGIFLFLHMVFLVLTFVLMFAGYDIIPFKMERLPLDIRDDVDYLRELAWKERNHVNNEILVRGAADLSNATIDERSLEKEFFDMIFRHPEDGNLLTVEYLTAIKDFEDKLWYDDEYQKKFCKLSYSGSDSECDKPVSLLRAFDGSWGVPADLTFSDIAGTLHAAHSVPTLRPVLMSLLSKDYTISPTEAFSSITRSFILLGGPLEGYTNLEDDKDAQEEVYKTFLFRYKDIADPYFTDGIAGLDFCFNSILTMMVTILAQVNTDMLLINGSFCFIACFIYFHTRSGFISFFSVISIICCFFEANFVYRVILGYRYFGIFHVLSMFIILGIGADDIFIFIDSWTDSSHHTFQSPAHRMSYVYKKASLAMFFTSVTTATAFFVSATSPFLGVFSFGMFSGLLIIVNYISVITFFPTCVLMYDKYFSTCSTCPGCITNACARKQKGPAPPPNSHEAKSLVVRFLRRPYFYFITHKIAKWVILFFFACVAVASIVCASFLRVSEERPNFFGKSTNIGTYITNVELFKSAETGDLTEPVFIVFGIKTQDISECHFTDPQCPGVTVWNNEFTMDDNQVQDDIKALCDQLKNMDEETISELYVQKSVVTGEPEVYCFLTEMEDTTYFRAGGYPDYPFTQDDWDQLKVERSDIYSITNFPAEFTDYFGISMGYWLYEEFNGTSETMETYNSLLGETVTSDTKTVEKVLPGSPFPRKIRYGSKLKYAAIRVDTTLNVGSMGYTRGLPVRDAWDEWVKVRLDAMQTKDTLQGYQINNLWHWYKIQQKLVTSAVTGIVIGLGVALPILIVATANWLVGLLATLIITLITVSVISVIPLAGWSLGLMESLNLVLVVGLSVDYVVHLAEGYARSSHTDRKRRTRDALEEVGVSVLSGAGTTLGASFFMLFAVIAFFTEFGVFVFSTIGFSVLYALGFFIPLLGIIGPEGDTGSIKPLLNKFPVLCGQKPPGNQGNQGVEMTEEDGEAEEEEEEVVTARNGPPPQTYQL